VRSVEALLSAANRAALAARKAAVSIEAPVTLNFHPDRRLDDGHCVAEGLRDDGVYRNQFETGISNGIVGGDRIRWERMLFAGACDGSPAIERPKYGALNVSGHAAGACPGFGSCHLRLRREVNARTTYLRGDSSGPSAYLEAHVHGPVRLASDTEAIVLDPVYAGTGFAEALLAIGCRGGEVGGRDDRTAKQRDVDQRGPVGVARRR
jgi:hypothetical protein